jgi:RNA polymerase sigma factor (TIGR02999 family)
VDEEGGAVTRLLRKWQSGDAAALDEVTRLVYQELRRLAAAYMRRERADHTLQPTALVAEAYVRLCGSAPSFDNRAHFLVIAARSMRRVLVDHARRHAAAKRGEAAIPVTLQDELLSTDRPEPLIALDDALAELGQVDERKAHIVELVYFGGLGQAEVADLLHVHHKTVARDLRLARAWLKSRLLDDA